MKFKVKDKKKVRKVVIELETYGDINLILDMIYTSKINNKRMDDLALFLTERIHSQ